MIEDLALPALRRVESQLDGRHGCRRDEHPLDLRCLEGALDKAAAQRAIRIGEDPRALDTDNAVFGKQDRYVETRGRVGAGSLVVHDVATPTTAQSGALAAGYSAVVQLIHGFAPAITKPVHDRILLGQQLSEEHRRVNHTIGQDI